MVPDPIKLTVDTDHQWCPTLPKKQLPGLERWICKQSTRLIGEFEAPVPTKAGWQQEETEETRILKEQVPRLDQQNLQGLALVRDFGLRLKGGK